MKQFKNKSFNEDTGATRWRPDTCSCVLIYDKDLNFLDEEKCCKLHMGLKSKVLLKAVLDHNRSFNKYEGKILTQEQKDEIKDNKEKELKRIEKL
jgi:acetyl-CoA carboxylase beta subunit